MGLAHTLVQSQGPRALFLEQSLPLEGKKVKGERPKTKEGVCQADEPGKPRVPPTPPHCSRKRVPGPSSPLTSSQGSSLTPHPTVGDRPRGWCPGRNHHRGAWQARKGSNCYHQGCQVVLQIGHRRSLLSPLRATQAPYFLNSRSLWPPVPRVAARWA